MVASHPGKPKIHVTSPIFSKLAKDGAELSSDSARGERRNTKARMDELTRVRQRERERGRVKESRVKWDHRP